MRFTNLKKNFIYQFLYQAVILVIPLIISPFLTRRIGDTGLGTYTYINSIAYYFVIFANLGIAKHGQRVISQNSHDSEKLRKTFWSLYFVHALISILSCLLFGGMILVFAKESKVIYVIEIMYVLSALFDVTWLFYGLENFKVVVVRNFIIKVVECILIFALIKSAADLWIYTFITAGGILLGQIIVMSSAIKQIKPIKFSKDDVKIHIKPLIVFSITVIAVSLYTVFDKTLLGIFSTKENVAYYEYANKILVLPRTFISVIGVVLYPRACKMAAEGKIEEQKKYLKLSILVVAFIGFATLFGLLSIGKDFAYYYYGESFIESGKVMSAMCAIPLIVGLGDIVRTQYLIPNHMDKEYLVCILLNAVINLILTFILIPKIGIYGAIIGTGAAELFGTVFQIVVCKKKIGIKMILSSLIPFCIFGAIMFGCLMLINHFMSSSLLRLFVDIGVGALIYSAFALIYYLIMKNLRRKQCLSQI